MMEEENKKVVLSIVSPVYMAVNIIPELVRQIEINVKSITDDYEIILVDDSSPDNSWAVISQMCTQNKKIKGLSLSRNFGQHYAITAGLSYSQGDWVVVMDCDLQDQPDEIPNLYAKAQEGYDIVFAQRIDRKDTFFKKLSSTLFHTFYVFICGSIEADKSIANFGIYSKRVIKEYNKMPEVYRSFGSLVNYLGFKKTKLPVRHASRAEGYSSYSLVKLLRLSSDVTVANSNKPLYFAIVLGFFISFTSFAFAIYNVIAYFYKSVHVSGFTTMIFSIWFVGGLILFVLGIVGLYIGKIFNQVKERQLYIVMDKINIE